MTIMQDSDPRRTSRDGWLTEEELDAMKPETLDLAYGDADEVRHIVWAMARAALRLYAERSALFTQLRAAIETVERGNV